MSIEIAEKNIKILSGLQKVATVLLSISTEDASQILALMEEDEIKDISYAMSNLGSVNSDLVNNLLKEFNKQIVTNASFLGDIRTTENFLNKVLGNDKAKMLLEEIRGPQGKNTWEKLSTVNEELLGVYLKNEHPQTAALILSKISPEHAAKVLSNMSQEFAFEIIARIVLIDHVKKEVLQDVEKILRAEFIATTGKSHKQDSCVLLAEIFHHLDRVNEEKFMGQLEEKMPDVANKVKELMFTFNDMAKIDAKGIQAIIRAVDKQKLGTALKGATQEIKQLFLSNMSERASRILLDDMEAMGPIKVKEADEAQMEVIKITKDLIEKGEVTVSDGSSEEYIQ